MRRSRASFVTGLWVFCARVLIVCWSVPRILRARRGRNEGYRGESLGHAPVAGRASCRVQPERTLCEVNAIGHSTSNSSAFAQYNCNFMAAARLQHPSTPEPSPGPSVTVQAARTAPETHLRRLTALRWGRLPMRLSSVRCTRSCLRCHERNNLGTCVCYRAPPARTRAIRRRSAVMYTRTATNRS